MAARLTGIPDWQFFDSTGAVLAGGSVYFYSPGTTTEKDIYDATDKQTTLSNPVVLDSAGRVPSPVFMEGLYDIVVKDASGNTIESVSNAGDDWSAVGTDLSENPISNHSFDVAGSSTTFENWDEVDSASVISRDTSDSYHGVACLKFTSSASDADYVTSDYIPISPGYNYSLDLMIKADNASARPNIHFYYYTAAQAFISSQRIADFKDGLTPTDWALRRGFSDTPPSTGRYLKIRIYGNADGTSYTTQFDDLRLRAVSKFGEVAPYVPSGLILSRDSGDTDHDIKITAGAVKSHDYAEDIFLLSDIVKRFDASFDEGTGNGGASSGFSLPASADFAVWLIKNSSSGHVDAIASSSYSSPTMPSGYDIKRLIGYCTTDSSNNIVDFKHVGNIFYQMAKITDVSDSSVTDDTAETGTFSVPPGSIGFFNFYWNYGSGQQANLALLMGPTGVATNTMDVNRVDPTSATVDELNFTFQILVDSSQQADYAVRDGTAGAITGTATIYTKGCIMLTRDTP